MRPAGTLLYPCLAARNCLDAPDFLAAQFSWLRRSPHSRPSCAASAGRGHLHRHLDDHFCRLRPLLGTQWANAISLVLCSVLNTDLNRRMSFGMRTRHLWWRDQRRGCGSCSWPLGHDSGSLWILHEVSPKPRLLWSWW